MHHRPRTQPQFSFFLPPHTLLLAHKIVSQLVNMQKYFIDYQYSKRCNGPLPHVYLLQEVLGKHQTHILAVEKPHTKQKEHKNTKTKQNKKVAKQF